MFVACGIALAMIFLIVKGGNCEKSKTHETCSIMLFADSNHIYCHCPKKRQFKFQGWPLCRLYH